MIPIRIIPGIPYVCDLAGKPLGPEVGPPANPAVVAYETADGNVTRPARLSRLLIFAATDPRDARPEHEMVDRHPMFRHHNCYRCKDGEKPCVRGNQSRCEYPHARND